MKTKYDKCTTTRNDKIVVIHDKKKKFRVLNPNRTTINEIKVDGCLFDNKHLKCDYMVDIPNNNTQLHLVEFKGVDINHAIKQLESTLYKIKNDFLDYQFLCHIVCCNVPKSGTKSQNLKKEFKRKNKCSLKISTMVYTLRL